MTRDRVLLRCHVCDCYIAEGEPHYYDGTGWSHPICSLQVTL